MQQGSTGSGARAWRAVLVALGLAACAALAQAGGAAQAATPYPAMAPLSAYLMADRNAEIALARSAAPPAVAADAEVLVLGPHGYVSAAPGKNGFVCLVERAWFSGLQDDGFWNPKLRGPDCYNREAARSVLPTFLTRTKWVLAGASLGEIQARTRAAIAAGRIRPPEPGAMNFMLSKGGYLGDDAGGPWHPHVMFFTPPIALADWGANLPGGWVFGTAAVAGLDPYNTFFVPAPFWSDHTPDENAFAHHTM
ncbi:MAG TPA: hypothetical protein VGF50_14625 [Caulobacteraceae bacterium]|jgi:hypothetical protein